MSKFSHNELVGWTKENWFKIIILFLAGFSVYWFGIRSTIIRQSCSVVEWIEPGRPASPAIEATPNWPGCEKENPYINPFELIMKGVSPEDIPEIPACHGVSGPTVATKATKERRPANDYEYRQCLREHGL